MIGELNTEQDVEIEGAAGRRKARDEAAAAAVDEGPGVGSALDPTRLAGVRRLGRQTGRDLIAEIVGIYRREGPVRIEAMRQALAGNDEPSLAESVHALGGSAVYLGAATLARLCRELEATLERDGLAGCERGLRAVEEEHRRVLEALGSIERDATETG